ncbi:MAG: hypothetical protein ACRCZE_01500 [Candidatus Altimarinota bacterium]
MLTTVYTISDIELGQKDLFDDFKDENSLLKFLTSISNNQHKTILVLNGDTFDFLKMPYHQDFPFRITEEISLWKLNQILKSYPKIFQHLQKFLENPHNFLHFNIGNHDFDLVWPALQNLLKSTLGHPHKITFDHDFNLAGLHIEHGQMYDFFYRYNPKKVIIKKRGEFYLNLPIGHTAILKFFLELKKQFPEAEKIFPRPAAYKSNPEFKKARDRLSRRFFWKGLFFDPLINLRDPISQLPVKNLLQHIYHYGMETEDDHIFLTKRLGFMRNAHPDKHVWIMGHSHIQTINQSPDYKYQIVTDTWREEYLLDDNDVQTEKNKTYAEIKFENEKIIDVKLKIFQ